MADQIDRRADGLQSLNGPIGQSFVPAVRPGQRPALERNDPLNIFGDQRQQTSLVAAAIAAKNSFTIWTFASMLITISPFPYIGSWLI